MIFMMGNGKGYGGDGETRVMLLSCALFVRLQRTLSSEPSHKYLIQTNDTRLDLLHIFTLFFYHVLEPHPLASFALVTPDIPVDFTPHERVFIEGKGGRTCPRKGARYSARTLGQHASGVGEHNTVQHGEFIRRVTSNYGGCVVTHLKREG